MPNVPVEPPVPPARRPWRAAVALGAVTLLLTSCSDTRQNWFEPEGSQARKIDNLQTPVFLIASVIGIIVFVMVAVIVIKFRAGRRQDIPKQLHGAPKVEILWTLAPAVLLAGIAVPTLATVFDLAQKADDALEITVIGQQWWWEYDYPGYGIVTANEMVIPAGKMVQLTITSRDVIHSFWIPKLNGKKDAVPGRQHSLTMQADQPGEYWGQCTEFCGLSHANMRMRVVALDDADWEKWLAHQQQEAVSPEAEQALRGETLFTQQCSRCHRVNGLKDADGEPVVSTAETQLVAGAAPNLTHLMSRTRFAGDMFPLKRAGCENPDAFTEQYVTGTSEECLDRGQLEAWLRNAPAMKPMYPQPTPESNGLIRGMPNLGLSEAQIDDLVAYLSTLK